MRQRILAASLLAVALSGLSAGAALAHPDKARPCISS